MYYDVGMTAYSNGLSKTTYMWIPLAFQFTSSEELSF